MVSLVLFTNTKLANTDFNTIMYHGMIALISSELIVAG